jgi:hypothetical protein
MSRPILSPDATRLELARPGEFQRFYKEYIELLKRKIQRITAGGTGQSYYTCGEIHDRSNKNWQPFFHLWSYTEEKGLDFYAVKDLIEEHLGREIICECEIMRNEKAIRRRALQEQFGVDFGEPGRREVDVA